MNLNREELLNIRMKLTIGADLNTWEKATLLAIMEELIDVVDKHEKANPELRGIRRIDQELLMNKFKGKETNDGSKSN